MQRQLEAILHRGAHGLEAAEAVVILLVAVELHKRRSAGGRKRAAHLLHQAFALEASGYALAEVVHDRRGQVDVRYGMRVHHALARLGAGEDERYPRYLVVNGGALGVQAVRVHGVAVIRGEHTHGVGRRAARLVQHTADLGIDKRVAAHQQRAVGRHLVTVQLQPMSGPQPLVFRLALQRVVQRGAATGVVVAVHGVIGRRAQAGIVRLVIRHHQQEVLILVLFNIVQRPLRYAVGKCELRLDLIGRQAGRGLARYVALLAGQLVQIVAHIVPVIGIPAVRAHALAEVIAAVQVPLAYVGARYALAAQPLAQRAHVCAQRHAVAPAAVGVRVHSCKQRRARRTAYRLAGICTLKAHALLRQGIDIGRDHALKAVAADHVPAGRIGHNPDKLSVRHDATPPHSS